MRLTPVQVRVMGCLLEKERTTPDNYPLTMNALLSACNQTTNRHPVVHLDEATVGNALENLRGLNLVRVDHSRSNRAAKWREVLVETVGLDGAEAAVLCLLMVRGPQTASELRARGERLHPFADQDDVDDALRRLAARPEPLAARLQRQAGQKESRWAQLVGGELAAGERAATPDDRAGGTGASRIDRLAALESAVAALQDQVAALRADHDALARQLA